MRVIDVRPQNNEKQKHKIIAFYNCQSIVEERFYSYLIQKRMLAKFMSHKNPKYILLYSFGYLAYGMHISGLGPYIPYITARTDIIQTQYSYLFTCRSLAMFMGGFFIKFLQAHSIRNHTILAACSASMGIFAILFCFTTDSFWLGLWLFLSSFSYSSLQILIMVCTILITPTQEMQFWMLLTHAVFGVGGLIGPFVLYIFQQYAFAIFGLLTMAVIPFYCTIITPQQNGFSPEKHTDQSKRKVISILLMSVLCFMLFFYIGLQCTYSGWISSYAVLTQVTNKQGATIFPSLFWIFMTLFRFILAFVPGTSSQKFKHLLQVTVLSGVISLVLIKLGHVELACYLSGLMFGLSLSSMYPLVFTLAIQQGLSIQDSQTSNIVMAGVMGEGILTMFVGMLMQWFTVNMLFYALTIVGIIMWILRYYALHLIEGQKRAIELNQTEIQLLDKNKTPMNQF